MEIIPKAKIAEELEGSEGEVFSDLEKKLPRLSDSEVRRIAEQISREMIGTELAALPAREKANLENRIRKLAYDIGIGLLSSGIWAALAYAMSHMQWLAGVDKSDEQLKSEQRMREFRDRLSEGMKWEVRDELDYITLGLKSRLVDSKELARSLLGIDDFKAFLAAIEQEDQRNGVVRGGVPHDELTANQFLSEIFFLLWNATQEKVFH